MAIFKIQAGQVVTQTIDTFIGQEGTIFYDKFTGELRLSDGHTPGGKPLITNTGLTSTGTTNTFLINNLTPTTSTNTGALVVAGGAGIAGDLVVGGRIFSCGMNVVNSIGYTGSKGEKGDPTGYTGSQGNIGYTGSVGYDGSQGVTGYTGSQGVTGYTGSQGDIGYTGSVGYDGSQGITGYTGSQGETGYWGSTGYDGSQGNIGYTGSQGCIGYFGSTGYDGSIGAIGYDGSVGYTGSQGCIGYSGSKGDTGIGFTVGKTYVSVAALTADTSPTGITPGQFAVIDTGNISDPDQGKTYLWNGSTYTYLFNLTTAGTIKGDTGYTGSGSGGGGTGQAYDQVLFTTSSVTFANITIAQGGNISFPEGSPQYRRATKMVFDDDWINSGDPVAFFNTLIPGDFYWSNSQATILLLVDYGGYYDWLDITVYV